MPRVEADRRASLAAWGASLAAHSLLVGGVLWSGLGAGAPQAGDEPTREVGIVVRQSDQPPAPFETPAEAPTDTQSPADSSAQEQLLADIQAAPSPFSGLLEELLAEPTPGPGAAAAAASSQAAAGGGGRPTLPIGEARVPFFGVEGVGTRFVYALDRSISMRGGPLRTAKAELLASLAGLGPTHQFQIVFFSTRVDVFDLSGRNRLAWGDSQSKRRAEQYVQSVTAEGGTERHSALLAALRYGPDVVFFLTDDDLPMARNEIEEVVGKARGTTIHAIEFGGGPDHGRDNFLRELAERTGGQRRYVDTSRLPD
ncbi:hypothetical protein [Botrimarina sp.]|uniref:hypothetical protein n=1 Tax=Botrimarina sp. TaxID=2795802 RepID=UPI0032EDC772